MLVSDIDLLDVGALDGGGVARSMSQTRTVRSIEQDARRAGSNGENESDKTVCGSTVREAVPAGEVGLAPPWP